MDLTLKYIIELQEDRGHLNVIQRSWSLQFYSSVSFGLGF